MPDENLCEGDKRSRRKCSIRDINISNGIRVS